MDNDIKQILMKNNALIRTKYNLTTLENRIFVYILFNLQKADTYTMICEISIKELKDTVIKSRVQKYDKELLEEILKKLKKGEIDYIDHEGFGSSNFIYSFKFIENDTKIRIKADKDVYDLLKSYVRGYTPIDLNIFFNLRNAYSQRFYDLFRLWSGTKKKIKYNIDDIKEMLKLKGEYKEYGQFKRRVIKPSISELEEKANMIIDFKEVKECRKVVALEFTVDDKEPRKYFEKNNKTVQDHQEKKSYNKKSKELKFKNFDERTYDYDELEKKLLGWSDD